jgi:hypothetical protein
MPRLKFIPEGLAVCFLAYAVSATAQNIAVPPAPETPLMPPAGGPTQYEQNQANIFGEVTAVLGTPFQWGPVALSPHGVYEISYGNGVQAAPGLSATTAIQSISPGALLTVGHIWSLDYTPTWQLYSNRLFHDTLDENAVLIARNSFDDWGLSFSQSYNRSDEPLVETGRQTAEQDYATGLQASYELNDQLRLSLGLNQDILFASGAPDNYQWSEMDMLHYLIIPQLDAFIGPTFGYTVQDPGFASNYIQAQAGLTWRATDRLDISVQGGGDHQNYLATGGGSMNTSTFGATVDYKPWDTTTLTTSVNRGTQPSLTSGQIDESLSFSASLQQRLLGHFNMGATFGYGTNDYINIGPNLANVRSDQFETYGLTLGTTVFQRCTLSLQYQNSRNLSNAGGFGFSSYLYGFTIGYRY